MTHVPASLPTLPRNPSKSDEIDHIRMFVDDLPRASYLRDILANVPDDCESLIQQDLGIPLSVTGAWEQRKHAEEAIKELHEEAKQLRAECNALETRRSRCLDDIQEARTIARRVASA